MLAIPRKRSVLIVEDDAEVRESLADVLRDSERSLVLATNGPEALLLLGKLELPCLVLLDFSRPKMGGLEFLMRLHRYGRPGFFPVLLMSAHSDLSFVQNHWAVVGTLRKPFDAEELLTWIDGYDLHPNVRPAAQTRLTIV